MIAAWRAKALGGCSSVNAAVAMRARPADFAKWTARDRRRMIECVKIARGISRSKAFSAVVAGEMTPGATVPDSALEAMILANLDAYAHPTSTAPMGDDGVVHSEGYVHGIDGLMVVDASIMPGIPSAPTNLTTMMIAEHIAARVFAAP